MSLSRLACTLSFAFITSCFSVLVNAAVIDFEPLAPTVELNELASAPPSHTEYTDVGASYTENGFTLNAYGTDGQGWWAIGTESNRYISTISVTNGNGTWQNELVATDSGLFDLISIDMSLWGGSNTDVVFTGIFADNSVVTQTFTLPLDSSIFATYTFSGFNDVTKVLWGNYNPSGIVEVSSGSGLHQFDNIVVNISSVPIPPAVWLFGTGLLGLVGMARRKKAA